MMKPFTFIGKTTRWFIGILLMSVVGFAQPPLHRGDTIRVESQRYFKKAVVGQLVNFQNDSLTFQVFNGKQFTIPRRNIVKLEVARGKKKNTGKGAVIGGISTGLALGLILAADVSDEQGGWFVPTPGQAFVGGLSFGGLVGSLTGAIIGRGIHSPRWVEVPVDKLTIAEIPIVQPPEATPLTESEQPTTPVHQSLRRWRITLSFGTCSSGPATDIEQAMRRDGFDDTSPGGWFGGPVEHPFSNTGFGEIGFPWTMEVGYTLTPHYDLALLLTHTPMGETFGYQNDPQTYLFLKYDVTTLSPVFIFKPAKIIQVGVGPGWVIAKLERDTGGAIVYREQKGRPGVVVQASLLYPTQTRFFVKALFQYRWTPEQTFGPIPSRGGYYDISHPLKEFKANFSHTFIGAGIGIHF